MGRVGEALREMRNRRELVEAEAVQAHHAADVDGPAPRRHGNRTLLVELDGEVVTAQLYAHEPRMLSVAAAAKLLREAMRDKSYRAFPMGQAAGAYLRWKRGRLTASSYRDYESALDKLARHFPDLELGDFDPPIGTERMEEFLDFQWGECAPRTFNKVHSYFTDFFDWAVLHKKMHGNPVRPIPKAKARDVLRETFSDSLTSRILAENDDVQNSVPLRLLLVYGLRKGALLGVQFKHFDHIRKRLTIFTKGGVVREVPIVERAFWNELERLILERQAEPHHYLLCRRKAIPHKRNGEKVMDVTLYPDKPMGAHGGHDWWYRCLERAGVVPKGVTHGERMHKARHTAGQRLLDGTRGNLKAVQRLLGHKSISTTGDIYTDWDVYQLADVLAELYEGES